MSMNSIELLEMRRLYATGFVATYFDNATLDGKSITRNDAAIAFSWKTSSPAIGIAPTTFSTRWTGTLMPTSTGAQKLYLTTDGGVRVWVNHKLLLNRWTPPGVATNYAVAFLAAAISPIDLQIEYQHNVGKASIGVSWQQGSQPKAVLGGTATTAKAQSLQDQIDHTLAFAIDRLGATYRALDPANGVPTRSDASKPAWVIRAFTDWTAGTFAGAMWEMNRALPGAGWDKLATKWTTPLAKIKQAGDSFDREYAAYRPLFDATSDTAAKQVLLASAALKLSVWNKTVRAFKTPELVTTSGNPKANFGVLMDQSMDMEHMLWAGEELNDLRYRDRVVAHMYTVARTMVRKNGSVIQRGYFDSATGAYVLGENSQGYNNTSTWSRAVGWAMHSFATVGTMTNNADFLAVAKKIADYYIANTPTDGVPFWDYQAPTIPNTYRDTSAAAISAGAMIKLAAKLGTTVGAKYRAHAETILKSLLSNQYLAEGATVKGILQHGAANIRTGAGVDSSLMFGDYYLLRAINDYRTLT